MIILQHLLTFERHFTYGSVSGKALSIVIENTTSEFKLFASVCLRSMIVTNNPLFSFIFLDDE